MPGLSGLTAAQLLEVVDAGTSADAAGRGRIMLAAAVPDLPAEDLDELSLGQRDAWVLALRCATFGDTLTSRVRCPECGLLLTVRVPREHAALQEPSREPRAETVRVQQGSVVVEARSPDGAALAAAARCADVSAARASLIAGCVVSATAGGAPVDPLELDDALIELLGEAIVEAEPQVEVRLGMTCAACGHEWAPVLDIVHYLWRELSTMSVQLLDEVHQLAVGYGWSEEQVLRLPSSRRRQYVERLAGG